MSSWFENKLSLSFGGIGFFHIFLYFGLKFVFFWIVAGHDGS